MSWRSTSKETITMTPSTSPTSDFQVQITVPVPESSSRELVDVLLEDGEHTALLDSVAIGTDDVDTHHLDEAVTGWGCSVFLPRSLAKQNPPLNARGKKASHNKISYPMDIDTTNIRVRCVGEDYIGDHHKSAWKANVEPGTYRYITNNGIYRSTKFANTGNDWVTVKRSRHPEPCSVAPEVKHVQRTLKKDLNQMLRTSEVEQSNNYNSFHKDDNDYRNSQSNSKEMDVRHSSSTNSISESAQPFHRMTISSGVAFSEPTDRPSTRDPFKDPQLIKSTSDLFIENFSSRMDALQKTEMAEIQATASAPRTPVTPLKIGSKHNGNGDAASQSKAEDDLAKDVFTVKSVPKVTSNDQLPLRPLEKLTPQQRSMDRGSESECSTHSHSTVRGDNDSPLLPSSFMNAMNAFSQLQYKHIRGSKNRSGPSTYRGDHNASANSTISDNDSLSSVRNALSMTNTSIERMRMRPYGRNTGSGSMLYDVKDYGKFLTRKYRLGAAPDKHPHTSTLIHSNKAKPPHPNAQRKGIVGYKPNIQVQSYNHHNNNTYNNKTMTSSVAMTMDSSASRLAPTVSGVSGVSAMASTQDTKKTVSPESNESYLSGTSMAVHRGSGNLREGKPGTMALPGISGKRLPMTLSSQRMI